MTTEFFFLATAAGIVCGILGYASGFGEGFEKGLRAAREMRAARTKRLDSL